MWVESFTLLPFYQGEITPGNHCIGAWVGLRTSLVADEKRKKYIQPGIESRSSS
jgi:hypothetical protein